MDVDGAECLARLECFELRASLITGFTEGPPKRPLIIITITTMCFTIITTIIIPMITGITTIIFLVALFSTMIFICSKPQMSRQTMLPGLFGWLLTRVRRLHLSTHSRKIHWDFMDSLERNGWEVQAHYPTLPLSRMML